MVNWKSPNGKPPTAVLANVGPWANDSAKGQAVEVWEARSDACQFRLMNTSTGNFGGIWPTQFSWLAVWM
ncbi:MAG: hypothetical protein SO360_01770 [Bifidobacterium tsurumiense]|uniref:hypothetical protein n=1 Tax=Bifidobacterium tsurumiense TaxID=356829 RepID=UPI002A80F83F|nr:hypothetical protein [Bifidobacterium tsurumiense]MDY4677580.1 hypothetical protein [Bifidobacterium tsurumiense]